MSNVQLNYLPGICKVDSPYLDSAKLGFAGKGYSMGRFTDMDGCRFTAGMPEQIGNTLQNPLFFANTALASSGAFSNVRALNDWTDFNGNHWTAYGDGTHFGGGAYVDENQTGNLIDITPLRSLTSGTLTNPFNTIMGSAVVTVNHTAHGLNTGDFVYLLAGAVVDGITITGYYTNIQVTNANTYTIVANATGIAGVSGGGGTTNYTYFRVVLSNPFYTTGSSKTVKVNHNAHGAHRYDIVYIAGASAVGGITPSGSYIITNIIDANNYDISVATAATSTVNGGGGTPNFAYSINLDCYNILQNGNFGSNWFFDNYGQQLILAPYGGSIFIWDPTVYGAGGIANAYPMLNAPTNIYAMFVTPEREVFALGTLANALLVQWPDQNDYTQWTSTAANTADQRTLKIGSRCVGGIAVRDGVSIVFTDAGPVIFTYSGDEFVYDSTVGGLNCGLVGPHAVTVMGQIAYWFSGKEFWLWNGSVQPAGSDDIRDYVVQNLSVDNGFNEQFFTVAGAHTAKKEVWFFYPSIQDTFGYNQPTRHVIFHADQSVWSIGTLQRNAWRDSPVLGYPISINQINDILYYHDITSANAGALKTQYPIDTTAIYITFSPMDISKGDKRMDIFSFIPDFERNIGNLDLYVTTQHYPLGGTNTNGPYALSSNTDHVDIRLESKLVGYNITSTNTSNFRLGLPRIDVQPAGARR
jgi:hypothetical protein